MTTTASESTSRRRATAEKRETATRMMVHDQSLLELALDYIAIAESGDAKREAYIRAADVVATHRDRSGDTNRAIAATLQWSEQKVGRLLKWRESGYETSTPFSGGQTASRAAVSHTRKVLREQPEVVAKEVAAALESPQVAKAVARVSSPKSRHAQSKATQEARRLRAAAKLEAPPTETEDWPTTAITEYFAAAADMFEEGFEMMGRLEETGVALTPETFESALDRFLLLGRMLLKHGQTHGLDVSRLD